MRTLFAERNPYPGSPWLLLSSKFNSTILGLSSFTALLEQILFPLFHLEWPKAPEEKLMICHGIILLLPMYHYIYHFRALRPPSSINIHTISPHIAYYCCDKIPQNTTKGSTYTTLIDEDTLHLELSRYTFDRIVSAANHGPCRIRPVFRQYECRQ